jgi:hypothetical protein
MESKHFIRNAYSSHSQFPIVGIDNILYEDTTSGQLYRWNSVEENYDPWNLNEFVLMDHLDPTKFEIIEYCEQAPLDFTFNGINSGYISISEEQRYGFNPYWQAVTDFFTSFYFVGNSVNEYDNLVINRVDSEIIEPDVITTDYTTIPLPISSNQVYKLTINGITTSNGNVFAGSSSDLPKFNGEHLVIAITSTHIGIVKLYKVRKVNNEYFLDKEVNTFFVANLHWWDTSYSFRIESILACREVVTIKNSTEYYYNKYVVYVDPNGYSYDDAEFGNRNKPFRKPLDAQYAAQEFLHGLGDLFVQENKIRVLVHILPGIYNYSEESFVNNGEMQLVGQNYTFGVKNIDYYLEEGVRLIDYSFDDKIFNIDTNLYEYSPIDSKMMGYGTLEVIGHYPDPTVVYLGQVESKVEINLEYSNIAFYIDNGRLDLNIKKYQIDRETFSNYMHNGMWYGEMNINIDELIIKVDDVITEMSIIRQGGGFLNLNINKYYGINSLGKKTVAPFAILDSFAWGVEKAFSNIKINDVLFCSTTLIFIGDNAESTIEIKKSKIKTGGIGDIFVEFGGEVGVIPYFQLIMNLTNPNATIAVQNWSNNDSIVTIKNSYIEGFLPTYLQGDEKVKLKVNNSSLVAIEYDADESIYNWFHDWLTMGMFRAGIGYQEMLSIIVFHDSTGNLILDNVKLINKGTSNTFQYPVSIYPHGPWGNNINEIIYRKLKIYGTSFSNVEPYLDEVDEVNEDFPPQLINLISGTSLIIDENIEEI